jgi:hypothetical protein
VPARLGFRPATVECNCHSQCERARSGTAAPEQRSRAHFGSRRTATRVKLGAISLSSSSHLPLRPYSNAMKPVALPPGRAKLSTKPAPTGSRIVVNTIGTVRVACNSGPKLVLPGAKITSGPSASSSAAYLRTRLASPAAQRVSIRTLRPSFQPNCCSPSKERRHADLIFGGVGGAGHKHAYTPHPLDLLRVRRQRPNESRAAQQRYKLAPSHDRPKAHDKAS